MTAHPLKKRQLIYSDDDSEEEFKPKLEEESDTCSSGVPSDDISDQNSDIEDDEPVKVKKRKQPPGKSRDSHKKMKTLNGTPSLFHDKSVLNTPSTSQIVGAATKIKLAALPKAESGETLTNVKRLPAEEETIQDSWSHLKYDFLKPEKIRDGQRRLPSDPEYNPRTLFVPQDFKNNLTPAIAILRNYVIQEICACVNISVYAVFTVIVVRKRLRNLRYDTPPCKVDPFRDVSSLTVTSNTFSEPWHFS
uniref:(California timema) hypothetical protein n=1 Tax=Timema californicum TaxID=61474 RepID=A0A7R9PDH0_TIMCA|nr:unnamed protein product [Timema californicum]